MSKELVEALKQFIRTVILGEIPVLIACIGIIKGGIDIVVGGFSINWLLVAAVFSGGTLGVFQTAMMSALDKWLHQHEISTPLDLTSFDSLKTQE